jgi:hypothetical protein
MDKKRKSEEAEEEGVSNKVKKRKSLEVVLRDAWNRLMKRPGETSCWHGTFLLKLVELPDGVEFKLSFLLNPTSETAEKAVNQLFNYFTTKFQGSVGFLNFRVCSFIEPVLLMSCTFPLPENWSRLESMYSVFLHYGPLKLNLEIRGMDILRGGMPAATQVQAWAGYFDIPGMHITCKELKDIIDKTKDEGKCIFKGSNLKNYNIYKLPYEAFPAELDIVELHPYEADVKSVRWERIREKQVEEMAPIGATFWEKPLREFTNISGEDSIVRFVAYAVWGNAEPLM